MAVTNVKTIQNPAVFPVCRRLKDSPLVVLFVGDTVGVVITGSEKYAIGAFARDWINVNSTEWLPVEVTING